jgi:uncharacterized protein (DUF362 family)
VVDAWRVMKRGGPRGGTEGDLVDLKAQLLSTDPVAVDAAATRLFGASLQDVGYIERAAQAGLGRIDLDALDIRRLTI